MSESALQEAAPASAAPPATAPRRLWIAGVLSIATPGLGHAYVGRARRGLFLALGVVLWAVLWLEVGIRIGSPAIRLLSVVLLLAGLVGVVYDSLRLAARAGAGFHPRWYNRGYVYLGVFLFGAILGEGVRTVLLATVARAFVIPSEAMQPTLLPGDYLMASPRLPDPVRRGTPVVYLGSDGGFFVSRAVGIPGDTLEMRDEVLYVNGDEQLEGYARYLDKRPGPSVREMLWQAEHLARPLAEGEEYRPTLDDWGPLVVPAGHYFLLGDNRDMSLDSRFLGFVPRERLVGQPRWIYYSRESFAGTRWSRLGRAIH